MRQKKKKKVFPKWKPSSLYPPRNDVRGWKREEGYILKEPCFIGRRCRSWLLLALFTVLLLSTVVVVVVVVVIRFFFLISLFCHLHGWLCYLNDLMALFFSCWLQIDEADGWSLVTSRTFRPGVWVLSRPCRALFLFLTVSLPGCLHNTRRVSSIHLYDG